MLVSIALILLTGLALGSMCKAIKLPSLVGMIIAGIILGPQLLNLIDGAVLDISAELRRIALVIILMRAGLSLDIKQLKKAGRPAILMCFVPATFEITAVVIFAPMLFGISYIEAALCGAVLAAVSPAVVVPRMVKIMGEGYGTEKQIPQIILAGASADDVYVIVLFTSFLSILTGGELQVTDFVQIPTSILLGAAVGVVVGLLIMLFFSKLHMRDTVKVIILLCCAFLLLGLEDFCADYVRISGLIGIMALGMTIFAKKQPLAKRLSDKYNKLWVAAEVVLFVLVGAAVDFGTVSEYGIPALILLLAAIVFRMAGVFVSLLGTRLNIKERLFCMMAYTPKATVQAAIGATALSLGLSCGAPILCVAVLAILISAPLGAFAIDFSYKKLLKKRAEPKPTDTAKAAE